MYVCTKSTRRLLLLFLVSLFALWPVASNGQETAPPAAEQPQLTAADVQPTLDQGGQLLSQGAYNEALQLFRQIAPIARRAYAEGADNGEQLLKALVGQGMALTGMQEFPDALEVYNEVLESQEEYAPALIGRGNLYLQANAPGNALPDFQKAIKSARGNPPVLMDALFGFGKSLVLTQQFQAAVGPLSKVIAQGQGPNMAEAYRLRGMALSGLDKFALADADFKESLSLNPDAHDTYFELGILNIRKKEYQAAVDEFARAIEKYKPPQGREDEPFMQGYMVKAAAHIEVGKAATEPAARAAAYQAAVDEAQKLYSLVDEESRYTAGVRAAALLTRGIGERMLGKLSTAIRTFSQALELNPAASEAYFRRGICLLEIGEDKMALSDFVQAASINYEDPRNNLWEGFVYAKMEDYHEAIRAYGDAIAASDRFTPAYINRGLAYMALGEDEKAIADFNDALRIEPTNGDYYYKRGVAYAQLGRLEQASNSLASAIEFAPTHREAYRQMAGVMQRLGRAELAEQYRKKAAELDAAKSTL